MRGIYAIEESYKTSYIWATRKNSDPKFTNDILFKFDWRYNKDKKKKCPVMVKSVKRGLYISFDYFTNYCNSYNVLVESGIVDFKTFKHD